jgi:crotonobetainyl-CoA:carnitine CoA-transferase CaiB-like acyl-CoA transferase
MTTNLALQSLKKAGIPAAEAQPGDSQYFLQDQNSHDNNFVCERIHPKVGKMQTAWNYIQFSQTSLTAGKPTPLLGEQTAEVLTEAGLDQSDIKNLFMSGAAIAEEP